MLVANELTSSANQMREVAKTLESRIDDTWVHRNMLASAGLDGPTAIQGLDLLASLGTAFGEPAKRLNAVADVLDTAAAAQRELDDVLARFAGWGNAALGPRLPLPPSVVFAHKALIATAALQSYLLDKSCAASVAGECLLEHKADLDRLVFHPGEPLDQISERNLSTAPASVRKAVLEADGMLLEAATLPEGATPEYGDGFTVMVGPPGDDSWRENPKSVITQVSGVSSGNPEALPDAIKRAQDIAAATGGAVVVWQGYLPPENLAEGADPSYARASAEELANFQMSMNDRFPNARKVVLGHSYGSVVATRAAMGYGLFADELVLAGSPGVPASNVDQLNLIGTDTRVTVADSPTDPILMLRNGPIAAHGFNPADPSFGAERIPGISGGHSTYFTDEAVLKELGEAVRR